MPDILEISSPKLSDDGTFNITIDHTEGSLSLRSSPQKLAALATALATALHQVRQNQESEIGKPTNEMRYNVAIQKETGSVALTIDQRTDQNNTARTQLVMTRKVARGMGQKLIQGAREAGQ